MKPHVHAELIKAWADVAEIEFYDPFRDTFLKHHSTPSWSETVLYRIKPKPKPDIVLFSIARPISEINGFRVALVSDGYPVAAGCNLKLVYDGETLAFKSAEAV
jgi:hypothetical protein